MDFLRAFLGTVVLAMVPALVIGQEIKDTLPVAPNGKTWKLVWHDEFDGTTLNMNKWVCEPEGKRRDGWWSRTAVGLDGKGHLVVETYRDGDKVIDGCITTQGKFEHRFGYYVARIQFQKQPGHWSAFWMMCNGVGRVGVRVYDLVETK